MPASTSALGPRIITILAQVTARRERRHAEAVRMNIVLPSLARTHGSPNLAEWLQTRRATRAPRGAQSTSTFFPPPDGSASTTVANELGQLTGIDAPDRLAPDNAAQGLHEAATEPPVLPDVSEGSASDTTPSAGRPYAPAQSRRWQIDVSAARDRIAGDVTGAGPDFDLRDHANLETVWTPRISITRGDRTGRKRLRLAWSGSKRTGTARSDFTFDGLGYSAGSSVHRTDSLFDLTALQTLAGHSDSSHLALGLGVRHHRFDLDIDNTPVVYRHSSVRQRFTMPHAGLEVRLRLGKAVDLDAHVAGGRDAWGVERATMVDAGISVGWHPGASTSDEQVEWRADVGYRYSRLDGERTPYATRSVTQGPFVGVSAAF